MQSQFLNVYGSLILDGAGFCGSEVAHFHRNMDRLTPSNAPTMMWARC
jgi:hypothetical protein